MLTPAHLTDLGTGGIGNEHDNVIVWIPHLQVTLQVQKGVGTAFPRVPTPLHPCVEDGSA